jgi:hypothetical protein
MKAYGNKVPFNSIDYPGHHTKFKKPGYAEPEQRVEGCP